MRKALLVGLALFALSCGCRKPAAPPAPATAAGEGTGDTTLVELGSGVLAVTDLANEPVLYRIPGHAPGLYRVPVSAVRNAPEGAADPIYVDTGVLYFVDADSLPRLQEIERRLWEETKDSYQLVARHAEMERELGFRYGVLESPGIGSGLDFEGDGAYVLDLSRVVPVESR